MCDADMAGLVLRLWLGFRVRLGPGFTIRVSDHVSIILLPHILLCWTDVECLGQVLQPFYGSLDFVRDNQSESVPDLSSEFIVG